MTNDPVGMTIIRPKRADDPMQYASGYTLDLYCDHYTPGGDGWHEWSEFPHQFTGERFGECVRAARKRGWKVQFRTRTATCPKCVKAA